MLQSLPSSFRPQRREAARNWLAFGLLLAAWNAADRGMAATVQRPPALRGYAAVSVRAVQRSISERSSVRSAL